MAQQKNEKKRKAAPKKRVAKDNKDLATRGQWSGAISFGLVNINVRVVSAREAPSLHFTMLDPSNLSPVGYKYYNKATGEDVSRQSTVKAYEYKDGKYVIMTDADFKKANPKATQTIDIESFVKLEDIDPVFFERAYYLLPNKGGEKGYALLRDALKKSGRVAIAKIVMHTKQHLVAILPRGSFLLLELLHFAEEVKELREIAEWKSQTTSARVQAKEVEMAEKLIQDMSEVWKPESYRDTYRADVLKRVQAKVKAGKATEITEDFDEREEKDDGQVLDLMPLLRKSLAKKSAKSKGRGTAEARAH